jgi:hypothetical protein
MMQDGKRHFDFTLDTRVIQFLSKSKIPYGVGIKCVQVRAHLNYPEFVYYVYAHAYTCTRGRHFIYKMEPVRVYFKNTFTSFIM